MRHCSLADALPFAKHTHSKLVCHVTKQIMDEDNPPMVLPNGRAVQVDSFETRVET